LQGLKKDFETAGFKPQVKPLADFQESYGLEADEDEGEEEEEEEGEEGDSDSGSEMEE
jgi:hypothetical protein